VSGVEQIKFVIAYLKGLLRDARRKGDKELIEYVGEIIKVYEGRLQSQNNNN